MKTVVYVPGLLHGFLKSESLENYAHRYLRALELTNVKPNSKYVVTYAKMNYGIKNIYASDIAIIKEIKSDGVEQVFCKLYMLDYGDLLMKDGRNKNLFFKFISVVLFLIVSAYEYIKSLSIGKQKASLSHSIQHMYLGSVFILVCLFGVLILPGLYVLLADLINEIPPVINAEILTSDLVANLQGFSKLLSEASLFVFTSLSLFFPKIREYITEYSERIIGLRNYIRLGDEKMNIIGKLEVLIDTITEVEQVEKVEVHGYSMGSIIVLDAFFPIGNKPAASLLTRVDTIVTIGCLYGIISKLYPKYFYGRRKYDLNIKNWYNVYSKIDVFASDFNSDQNNIEASGRLVDQKIKPQNIIFEAIDANSITFADYIFMIGLRAHTMYWGSEADSVNCLRDFILVQQKNLGTPHLLDRKSASLS
jgi:hypothetical protein